MNHSTIWPIGIRKLKLSKKYDRSSRKDKNCNTILYLEFFVTNYIKDLGKNWSFVRSLVSVSLPKVKISRALDTLEIIHLNNYYKKIEFSLKGIKNLNKANILENLSRPSKFIAAPQYQDKWPILCQVEHYTYNLRPHS